MTQCEKSVLFGQMHWQDQPRLFYNIWDAGTALAVVIAKAKAVATSSWSVAAAHGYEDARQILRDLVLAIIFRITASVKVPLTVDFEAGYMVSPH